MFAVKTGLSKEDKEFISQIENKLAIIARQGRFITHDGKVFQGYMYDESTI